MMINVMSGRVFSFIYFIVDNKMNLFVEIKCIIVILIFLVIMFYLMIMEEDYFFNNFFEYKL